MRRMRLIAVGVLLFVGIGLTQIDVPALAALPIVVGLYLVAVETSRGTTVFAVLATSVAIAAATTLLHPDWWTTEQTPWPTLAWACAGAAFGAAVRSRRIAIDAAEERNRQTERAVQEEARRRVVEGRLGVARDVHDVVGHHIAVVNVQAGVAAQLLREQPDDALEALGHVQRSARTVLTELGGLVSVLRDPATDAVRGLAALDELLSSQAAAGLQVDSRISGTAVQLPAELDQTAYRVLQEALSNARKHGNGHAEARLHYDEAGLNIVVRNEVGGHEQLDNGHGLAGLRERVEAVNGTIRAGREGERNYLLEVLLPTGSEVTS